MSIHLTEPICEQLAGILRGYFGIRTGLTGLFEGVSQLEIIRSDTPESRLIIRAVPRE